MIKASTVINGPDGMGYRFVKDMHKGDLLQPSHLEPFGGAPEPKPGAVIPEWLWFGVCQSECAT